MEIIILEEKETFTQQIYITYRMHLQCKVKNKTGKERHEKGKK